MAGTVRRLAPVAVATAIGVAILIGLGSWQLSRLSWKEGLVARVTERIAAEPVALPPRSDWARLDLSDWAYRRVRAVGVFDHAREARVYINLPDARGRFKGPGYFILTPLALTGGKGIVLVNRGFVPEGRVDPATRAEGQPAGEVTVVGALREPEGRNMFTPADQPEKRLFFDRDPKAIAAGLGLKDAAPFTIDADATPNPGGLPQGGETRVSFPNRHLEYALTWYGLAGALIAVFLAFAWRTVGEERDGTRRAAIVTKPR
ncbi:SURF1 family protein [Hansschlegelia zhihuaiae]|uniref:SURF1-like protein n=1 Tax=Hansschlegelia zhihuaiae TaxID=405005 RepID=A0A4Q0MI98_9HYPH|nr:SURF1 family protein [Hansschlegelia zhihuaiae]RXF73290.1 SURF1 family protein [Hansschlegelia zhihuaiae]